MEIKEGMYARTKSNGIVKIDEVIENGVITYEDDFGREWEQQTGRKVIRYISKDGWNCGLDENDVLKASFNIIDLIEVGDYVNGVLINDIDVYPSGKVVGYRNSEDLWEYDFKNNKIKSIVTKEQFSAMEYKVESEVK